MKHLSCAPFITNRDMKKNYSFDGVTKLNENDVAIPCGIIAFTYFNGILKPLILRYILILSRRSDFIG